MSIQRLEELLAHYRPEKITDFKRIAIGVSNETYSVTTKTKHRYVIRIILLQTAESARAEALIQQVMVKHGISTPVYLALDNGGFVGQDGADTFTIAKHISGVHPEHASLALVESLGGMMAKLHTILDQKVIGLDYNTGQWLNPRNAAMEISRCRASIQKRLQNKYNDNLFIFDSGLPMAIIHGELASNNIFAVGDHVTTLFDFETTEYAPRILDVAYTYLSFVYDEELSPSAVLKALIKGYNANAKMSLTTREYECFTAALQYVSSAAAAWCFSRGYDEYGEKFLRASDINTLHVAL